jgi:hypothetical protein
MRGGLVREMPVVGKSRRSGDFPALEPPTIAGCMADDQDHSAGPIDRAAFDAAFPHVTDALTLYAWRTPALALTRTAAQAGIRAPAVVLAEGLLAGIVFWLFWTGRYWPGLIAAVAVMILSVTALMLARCMGIQPWADRLRQVVELVHPLLWWWAWAHGLGAYGRVLGPVYTLMVLWVAVGGAVALRVIERLSIHRFGIEIHAWRSLDSRFRLIGSDRNSNLVILGGSLLFGRPDSGLVLVAWWTLISLIFNAVRLAQMTERQAQRHKIVSWLEQ